jgi:hypothetical protein
MRIFASSKCKNCFVFSFSRPHSEVLPGAPMDEEEALAKKRMKLEEDLTTSPIAVRDAISAFALAWHKFNYGKVLARFPPEMEPALAVVGQVAMASHSKGWISNEVLETLGNLTGFSSATIKPRLRRGADIPPAHGGAASVAAMATTTHGAGSSSTGAAPGAITIPVPVAQPPVPNADAIAFIQALGGEFTTALEISDEAKKRAELQKLLERHLEEFSTVLKNFTSSFSEPPKRSPWNDAIRAKIKLLFAINDSMAPPPLSATTLRQHLLTLWPVTWDVKDTQIKPLTRYAPKPAKTAEADSHPKISNN